ncbi:methyltransferase family protein [Actinocorallia herbida]|uniref:Methyltransferase family protein n=1 Tax=Actinocorallia herbida TaxID=58109 RepID=A0A3N1CZN2_9ACTN|nr:class I SAM-dependent methyltransferase [Actinocorallia herbida]ROO86729.1 methyltransferase family protein [Actinocorallia herbida]
MNGRRSDAPPRPDRADGPGTELEALLYDWHNTHRLSAQSADLAYWAGMTGGVDSLLVVGAGTGRVAVPLARHRARTVTALDLSAARLRRMPAVPGLTPVCGDMRAMPLRGGFGGAIVPYSTLQLLRTGHDRGRALAEAARVLDPGAPLYLDVSGSFDTRTAADWRIALSAPCPEVGETVVEWERCGVLPDHVLLEKSFRTEDGAVLLAVEERWAFLRVLDLDAELDRAGFDVTGVDHGYGADRSPHRRIYHARRRP